MRQPRMATLVNLGEMLCAMLNNEFSSFNDLQLNANVAVVMAAKNNNNTIENQKKVKSYD